MVPFSRSTAEIKLIKMSIVKRILTAVSNFLLVSDGLSIKHIEKGIKVAV